METTKEKIAILWMPVSLFIFTIIILKWSILLAFKFEYILATFLFLPIEIIPAISIEIRAILSVAFGLPIIIVIALIPYFLVTELQTIRKYMDKTINFMMIFIVSYSILYLVNNTFSISFFVQELFKVEKVSLLGVLLVIQLLLFNIFYKILKAFTQTVKRHYRGSMNHDIT